MHARVGRRRGSPHRAERRVARKLIARGGYDLVISDNRFNFYHPDLPCIFLSHQLKFAFPDAVRFMIPLGGFFNGHFHKNFLRVIVPDYADEHRNLTGLMSHGFPVRRSRPYYAGIICSVRKLDVPEDVDLFIPHQANDRITNMVGTRMGLPAEKVVSNIARYGNTTAATIPICICESRQDGRLKKDSLLLLAAFGSGFTWASLLMRWSA